MIVEKVTGGHGTTTELVATINYLLSPKPEHKIYQEGERLALLDADHIPAPSVAWNPSIAAELVANTIEQWMALHREGKGRGKTKGRLPERKFQHVIFSFSPEDKIAPQKALEIVREMVNEVTGGGHPAIYAIHGDTAHLHVHVVLGTVNKKGLIFQKHNDFRLWELAAEAAEIKHGLVRVEKRIAVALAASKSGDQQTAKARMPTTRGPSSEEVQSGKSTRVTMQRAIEAARKRSRGNFDDFVTRLAATGIEFWPGDRTGPCRAMSFRHKSGEVMKTSDLFRHGWSKLALQVGFSPYQHQHHIDAARTKKAQWEAHNVAMPLVLELLPDDGPSPKKKRRTSPPTGKYKRTIDRMVHTEGPPDKYSWPNSPTRPVIIDSGSRISITRTSQSTVRAAIQLARDKGWRGVHLTGNKEFRRLAWLEASKHGLNVTGYEPTQLDISELQRLREEKNVRKNERTGTTGGGRGSDSNAGERDRPIIPGDQRNADADGRDRIPTPVQPRRAGPAPSTGPVSGKPHQIPTTASAEHSRTNEREQEDEHSRERSREREREQTRRQNQGPGRQPVEQPMARAPEANTGRRGGSGGMRGADRNSQPPAARPAGAGRSLNSWRRDDSRSPPDDPTIDKRTRTKFK